MTAVTRITETDLLEICQRAARLELRGASYSADDRADCSSELLCKSLAEHGGNTPPIGDPHGTLTYFCGQAKNWRASEIRRRKVEQRGADATEETFTPSAEHVARNERLADGYSVAAAEQASDDLNGQLDLPARGPVWAALYQRARDCSAQQAADEQGVSLETWKKRTQRGGATLRALFPSAADLLGFLEPDTEPERIYRGVRLTWPDRFSADDGYRPARVTLRSQTPEARRTADARTLTNRYAQTSHWGSVPTAEQTPAKAGEWDRLSE